MPRIAAFQLFGITALACLTISIQSCENWGKTRVYILELARKNWRYQKGVAMARCDTHVLLVLRRGVSDPIDRLLEGEIGTGTG